MSTNHLRIQDNVITRLVGCRFTRAFTVRRNVDGRLRWECIIGLNSCLLPTPA